MTLLQDAAQDTDKTLYNRLMNPDFQNAERDEEQRMNAILDAYGYTFIYGGGSGSKGHGYWIQQNGETVKHEECERYGNLNPYFWMMEALCEKFGMERNPNT